MEIKKSANSLLGIISGNSEIKHLAEDVAPIISDLSERPLIPDLTGETETEKPEKPEKTISEKPERPERTLKPSETNDDDDDDDDDGTLSGEAAAPMLTIALDMLQARGASLISKRDYHQYKFSKADKKEFEKALAAYLATTNFKVSPLGAFLTVAFMMIGGNMAQAYEDKLEDKETAANAAKLARLEAERLANNQQEMPVRRAPVSMPFNPNPVITETPIIHLPRPVNVQPVSAGRRKFKVDENGKFVFNTKGVYLKVAERKETPSPEIARLVRAGKSNKDILETIAKNG